MVAVTHLECSFRGRAWYPSPEELAMLRDAGVTDATLAEIPVLVLDLKYLPGRFVDLPKEGEDGIRSFAFYVAPRLCTPFDGEGAIVGWPIGRPDKWATTLPAAIGNFDDCWYGLDHVPVASTALEWLATDRMERGVAICDPDRVWLTLMGVHRFATNDIETARMLRNAINSRPKPEIVVRKNKDAA